MILQELNNNEELTDFIREKINSIAKKLRLKMPQIEISKEYTNCTTYNIEYKILFGLAFLNKCKDKDFRNSIIPSDVFYNRVYFVIAHEMGHILQFTRHPKWYNKYFSEYNGAIGIEDYGKQKLEKNASKIASILLKEYKDVK